jgi:hypothetical protein
MLSTNYQTAQSCFNCFPKIPKWFRLLFQRPKAFSVVLIKNTAVATGFLTEPKLFQPLFYRPKALPTVCSALFHQLFNRPEAFPTELFNRPKAFLTVFQQPQGVFNIFNTPKIVSTVFSLDRTCFRLYFQQTQGVFNNQKHQSCFNRFVNRLRACSFFPIDPSSFKRFFPTEPKLFQQLFQ